jgi:hypothetical protein
MFLYPRQMFGKIQLLFRSMKNKIFPFARLRKFVARSCEDRREYSYTAYIPERRSGRDRRKKLNEIINSPLIRYLLR